MSSTVSVAVVGGGMAGLAAAYFLEQYARREGWHLTGWLVEMERRLGGKVCTLRDGPFLVELGPDSFFTQKPWAVELAQEVGLGDALIAPKEKRVYLLRRGRLHPVPAGLLSIAPAGLKDIWCASFLSLWGKARASLEPFIPPRKEAGDEPLGAFLRRRLGREWVERIGEPLMAGVHAGNAGRLSLHALYPTLAQWERRFGSLARARKSLRTPTHTPSRLPPFLSLAPGVGALPQAVASRLTRFLVLLGRRAVSLSPQADGRFALALDDGKHLLADAVILALPSFAAGVLVGGFAPEASTLLNRLEYASTATVTLAFRQEAVAHPLGGSGFLVPRTERFVLTGCTWVTSKWPERAPQGFVLLRAFLGWAEDASPLAWDDITLVEKTTEALRPLLGLRGQAERVWVHRWPHAMPQYAVGHQEWLARVERALAPWPGLVLAGSAYRGVGIPDCIRQGQQAAEKVAELLRARSAVNSPLRLATG